MFDINVLPMNLYEGRNLGELPGLKIFTAPKCCEKSRQNDVLVLLMTAEKLNPSLSDYDQWGQIISEAYYTARGSFTMGITAAEKKFGAWLDKAFPGLTFPVFNLNMAIIRDKTLLIGHAGIVNTTIIYADHVDNFYDESSSPVNSQGRGLRFFQVEIHSGDLILLCPKVPHGWTNDAILDATSESPLNVLRYLFDLAQGNLRSAVIQVKAGRGEIIYRYKPPIITSVTPGSIEEDATTEKNKKSTKSAVPEISGAVTERKPDGRLVNKPSDQTDAIELSEEERPLFRLRTPKEPTPGYLDFLNNEPEKEPDLPEEFEKEELIIEKRSEESTPADEDFSTDNRDNEEQTGVVSKISEELQLNNATENAAPEEPDAISKSVLKAVSETDSETLQASHSDDASDAVEDDDITSLVFKPEEVEIKPLSRRKTQTTNIPRDTASSIKKPVIAGNKIKRVMILVVCAVLIPVIAALSIFYVYSSRGKNALYVENLDSAVDTAQIALQQTEPLLQTVSWEKVIEYLDEAERYGSSSASRELRSQAYAVLDSLSEGRQTVYSYVLSESLPKTTVIKQIESSGQYIYILDETSGGIIRLSKSGRGLSVDPNFSCQPGESKTIDGGDATPFGSSLPEMITVGKLIDFVTLPVGSLAGVVAGFDRNGNMLYCAERSTLAASLVTPPTGKLKLTAVSATLSDLYVLDSSNNAVWTYGYKRTNGYSGNPISYYGGNAPNLVNAKQIIIHDNHSYFLNNDGTLTYCDYTGYTPSCNHVTSIGSDEKSRLDLQNMNISEMKMNQSPDYSLYLMDEKMQTIINVSLKMNFVRYIVPDRQASDGAGKRVSALGMTDTFTILWASGKDIYSGRIP